MLTNFYSCNLLANSLDSSFQRNEGVEEDDDYSVLADAASAGTVAYLVFHPVVVVAIFVTYLHANFLQINQKGPIRTNQHHHHHHHQSPIPLLMSLLMTLRLLLLLLVLRSVAALVPY